MIRPKYLKFYLLLRSIIFYSFYPGFCRAQGPSRDPCQTSGECGPFGICNSKNSPICNCLQGFNPRNNGEWNSGNWTGGCVRRRPLNCEAVNNGSSNEDGFLKLRLTISWDYTDLWIGPENGCLGRCLSNCSCLAYAYDVGVGCMFWRDTLIDLREIPGGSNSDIYIRVSHSDLDQIKEPMSSKKNKKSKKIIIIPVVVGFVIISIVAYFSWKWIDKHRGKKRGIDLAEVVANDPVDTSLQDAHSQFNLQELPLFKCEILANATNNFSEANKLGKGGFGPVYKGKLANGREIAIKQLSKASSQGVQEFMNELVLISRLQHRNLVRLLGCCIENRETTLIYEYMPNKSLDFFLFDPSQEVLDWRKRFNIIKGICRGLLYLHRDSRLKIIHRDLKPSNILLDNDWNPKISDFGIARIFGTQQDHVSTARVVGTYGYMAPEYALEGRFSEKSDVFSYGVLILEIATGKKNNNFHQDGCLNLLGHVWNMWNEDNVGALIDSRISSSSYRAEVMRCIHIGLLCVQELPKDRPSVSAVLSMLSSEILKLPEPKQPAFAIKSSHSDTGTSSSQQSQQNNSSVNEVTFTTVDAR